jgi:ABC-type transport system involved in cytochrome c biogenesis ATPase subunit
VKKEETFWLRNICATFKPNSLTIIKGKVGAGKSSLLLTILGEMSIFEGKLKRSGRMAYLE